MQCITIIAETDYTLPFLTDCRYLGQKEEIYLICLRILLDRLRVLNVVEMVKVVTN
jgi:hypothetical protein